MTQILADGTYIYRVNGVEIRATVQSGIVTDWQRNGLSAAPHEFAAINFTSFLLAELAERERLAGLLTPIEFVPASAEAVAA